MLKRTILALAMIVFGTAQVFAEEIKFGAFFSEKASFARSVLIPWSEWIEKETGGDLKVKFFFGGSLGRNPREQYKLVTGGVMDAGFVVPSYTPGTFPDLDILQAPNMARSAKEGSNAAWALYEQGHLTGLDKVKVVGIATTGSYAIHTNKPIKSVADIAGLKLRSAGAIQNQIIEALGGVPVGMSPTKIAENMTRGLLDGSFSEWNAAKTFKVLDVSKSHYHTSLGTLPIMVLMNLDKYNSLSDKAKAAIDASGPVLAKLQGEASDAATAASVEAVKGNADKTYTVPSAEDQAVIDAKMAKILDGMKATIGEERWAAFEAALEAARAAN